MFTIKRKNKNEKTLTGQTIFTVSSSIILNALSFITVPIFVNLLSTEGYGLVSLYSSYVQILAIVIGLQTYASISIAAGAYKGQLFEKYCSSILFLSLCCFTVVSVICFSLIIQLESLLNLDWLTILMMVMESIGSFVCSFYSYKYIYTKQAKKSFFLSLLIVVLTSALSIALILIFKQFGKDYLGRIIGLALPYFSIGLFLIIIQFKKGKTFFNKQMWHFCAVISIPMIFHNLSQVILSQTDKIMLKSVFNDLSLVAYYSYAVTIAHVVTTIWSAINNAWIPFLFDDYRSGNYSAIRKKSLNYIVFFSVLIFGYFSIAPEIITWTSGVGYSSSLPYLPLLILSCYFVFLYSFSINAELYNKKTWVTMIGTILAAGINVLLNYFMIPLYGAMGAALATFVSYFLLLFFHYIIAKLFFKKEFCFPIWQFVLSMTIVGSGVAMFYIFIDVMAVRWAFGFAALLFLLLTVYKRKSLF